MEIFGWIIIWLLAIFGVGILVLFAIPFVVSEIKSVTYKTLKEIEDKKIHIDEISKSRQLRNAKLREKQNELEDKKLTLKMQKLDKKCLEEQKKIDLSNSMTLEDKEEVEKVESLSDTKEEEDNVTTLQEEDAIVVPLDNKEE